jgi:hypothetical protein
MREACVARLLELLFHGIRDGSRVVFLGVCGTEGSAKLRAAVFEIKACILGIGYKYDMELSQAQN